MTNAEKQEILNAIKAESQSVDELVEVSSLDNIKSLPALRGSELVSAPLTLLRKPADDAAATANASATKADNAAALANKAAGMASDAAGTANQAAETANSAAAAASAAAKQAEDAAAGVNDGLVGGMTAVPDEENDTVKLTLLGKTGTEIASVDIPGGTGGGGNTYNVTAEVPLRAVIMSFPPRSVPWMRNTVTRAVASPMKSRRANGRPNSSWGQVCRAGGRRRAGRTSAVPER